MLFLEFVFSIKKVFLKYFMLLLKYKIITFRLVFVLGGNDTCKGDSGGPLMQSQLNSDGYLFWTQLGIVSWGVDGCGKENTYGYYTHVQRLRPWIDLTVERAMEAMR